MQITLVAVVLVCLVPAFQKTTNPIKQKQTLVEVWCGGDDNLTEGLCRALDSEFASTPDFVASSGERPGTLIVTIPTNVDWKDSGKRTRVFYIAEFRSTNEKKLGGMKGALLGKRL